MSQLFDAPGVQAVVGGLRRQQVMDVTRGAAFVGAFLLAWVSLHPFPDLSDKHWGDVTLGSETLTYAAFGCLAVLMAALVIRDNMPGLKTLASPGYLLFGGWIVVTVLTSLDPGTSLRRFVLTACALIVAAAMPLLPKDEGELARWIAIATLGLLAICYLGLLLVPNLSIHLATDGQEPALAGDWRGSFGHKNSASAVMAMVLFLGIYVLRSGAWLSGITIVALTALFLCGAGGKSSLVLSLAVLVVTSVTMVVQAFWLRALVMLTPLLLLNLLSIGTVIDDSLAGLTRMLPLDTSFTGRTEIWSFALSAARLRPWTGYGFAAFWGGPWIRSQPDGAEWFATASDSHNGYLDIALAMGLPGLVLLVVVLVIAPLRDFHAADSNGNRGPLAMAFQQIWLFGIYAASMGGFFLDRHDPVWFTFMVAVFGLHYLARFRLQS